jgi:hypothetical protein
MNNNLLANSGFEAEWGSEGKRRTWACGDGHKPYEMQPGEGGG